MHRPIITTTLAFLLIQIAFVPTMAEIYIQEESIVVEGQKDGEREAIHATLIGTNQRVDFTLSCFNQSDLIAMFWFGDTPKRTGRVHFSYASEDGKFRNKRGYLSGTGETGARLVVENDHTRRGGMAPIGFLKNLWNSGSVEFRFNDDGDEIIEKFDLQRFNQFWFGRILEECGRQNQVGGR